MKRFTLAVLLLIGASVAAKAQTPPAAPAPTPRPPAAASQTPAAPPKPGSKIGVILFQDAVLDSDAGKAAVAEIEKQMNPIKTQLEKLSKEMQDLQTKLQNAKTETEQAPIRRDMDAKQRDGQRAQDDGQRLSQDLQAKHLQPVAILVNKMVEEYAKENDLAIVVDPATDNSNIIFASKTSDITNEVIRRMNAAYAKDPKVTAPGTGTPAPAATPAAAPRTNP
jgi:Skp family chaperone for outer membrane proteins